MKPLLTLTDAAIEKVKYFASHDARFGGQAPAGLRPGRRLLGLPVRLQFDEKNEGDNVMEQGGITVLVDPQSATYLKDAP